MLDLSLAAGVVGTGLSAAVLAAAAYFWSSLLFREAPARVRFCGAAVAFVVLYGVLFYVLLALRRFEPLGVAVGVLLVAGSAGWGSRRWDSWRETVEADWGAVADFLRFSTVGWRRWVTYPLAAVTVVYFLRALVLPPLAWDSLTYHLVRAALWTKEHGLTAYDAPGAWQDYKHLMPLGDALSAGAMVLTRSDLLVPVPWLGVWVVYVGATYAAARELGAVRRNAWLAGLAAGFVPAVSAAMFVAYVDNLVAALVVAAFVLFIHGERRERLGPLIVGMASLGAAFAVKKTGIPFWGAGSALFVYFVVRDHREQWATAAVGYLAVFLATSGPPAIYLWVTEGSPVHPWGVRVGEFVLFEGRTAAFSGGSGGGAVDYPTALWVKQLLFMGYRDIPLSHINFGPAAPIFLGLAIWAGFELVRNEIEGRWTVLIFGVVSVLLVHVTIERISLSAINIARYAVAGPAIWLAVASTRDRRWVRWVLGAGLAAQLVFWAPTNWSFTCLEATGWFALASAPFGFVAGLFAVWARGASGRMRLTALVVTGGLLLAALATVLEPVRSLYRYDFYRQAAMGNVYTNHVMTGNYGESAPSSPIWRYLDKPDKPSKIAVTAGWDGRGLNWFVYPFFGRRLQNDILYVPTTRDGRAMSSEEKHAHPERADSSAWLTRLKRREVDYVAALAPEPLEVSLMEKSRHFELVTTGLAGKNRLYRVRWRGGGSAETESVGR